MRLLETEWDSFRRAVVPKNAPQIQLQEMRRAFFAGAAGLLVVIADTKDEDDANDTVMKVQGELDEFQKRVRRGEA